MFSPQICPNMVSICVTCVHSVIACQGSTQLSTRLVPTGPHVIYVMPRLGFQRQLHLWIVPHRCSASTWHWHWRPWSPGGLPGVLIVFDIYIYIYIYIYIDGCWCLLMLIDVWEFWMMLIPFFDLWINLYHRSIFSRIVAFSMDKEQRRQNHSGPCMRPPW